MRVLLQDVTFAFRGFLRSPLLSSLLCATMAIAIGANSAVFTLIHAVILSDLPVADPGSLVIVGDPALVHLRADGVARTDVFSCPAYRDFRDGNHVFSGLVASGEARRVRVGLPDVSDGGAFAEPVVGALVSGNYFDVFGLKAHVGRLLTPADDTSANVNPVVVISYHLWETRFGSDPGMIGRTVLFNGYPLTVIGVAGQEFFGDTVGDRQEFWAPLGMQPGVIATNKKWLDDYRVSWLHFIGRLKPGTTLQQAQADLDVLLQHLIHGPHADAFGTDIAALSRARVMVSSGGGGFSEVRARFEKPLVVVMALVGMVLLIAVTNIAGLLLARGIGRQKEIATRLALGASSSRIVRQLLTESTMVTVIGGLAGVLLARWGAVVLQRLAGAQDLKVSVDRDTLLLAIAASFVAGVSAGIAPAWRARRLDLIAGLRSRSAISDLASTGAKWNWGNLMVSGQIALSVTVLFAATLLTRSLQNLRATDLGYTPAKVLTMRTDPIAAGYKSFAQRVAFAERVSSQLARIAGVSAVTYSKNGLFTGGDTSDALRIEGYTRQKSDDAEVMAERAGPGYFSTLRIPLLSGRDFDPHDLPSSRKVAVINQSMARHYFAGRNPIGQRLWMEGVENTDPFEIVGVCGEVHDHTVRGRVPARYYVPLRQSGDSSGELTFIVKTAGNPDLVAPEARAALKSLDPGVPIINLESSARRVEESLRSDILIARLASAFGVVSLLLVSVGLYGLVSWTVSRRTRDIGVRMALGARPGPVLWSVLRQSLGLTAAGLLAGTPLAMKAGTAFSSFLFGVPAADVYSLIIVAATLAIVAITAAYIPALRAVRVDPLIALREE